MPALHCQLTNNDNDLISGTGSWRFCVDNFGKDSQMSPHNFLYYTNNRCFGVSVFLAWIIMTTQDSSFKTEIKLI